MERAAMERAATRLPATARDANFRKPTLTIPNPARSNYRYSNV